MMNNDDDDDDVIEPKMFNDTIHGQIEIPALCVAIIDTPEFQRLRYIKQVAMSVYVYPGGNHTRFEHCIGVGHLAGVVVKMLKEKQPELGINERDVLCAQVAGLCHDLGHGPFSHTWQHFLQQKNVKGRASGFKTNWRHEDMSVLLFDYLCEKHRLEKCLEHYFGNDFGQYVQIIKQQINGTDETRRQNKWQVGNGEDKSYLYEIVANYASHVDVDKWDYLSRDCHHMGFTQYFDYARLASLARVLDCTDNRKHVCFSRKATLNIQDMFHTRWKLHRMAYRHKVVKVLDNMLLEALCLADLSITVQGETGKDVCLSEAANDLVAFTKLTDHVLQMIVQAKPVAAAGSRIADDLRSAQEILTRIECRKLYGVVHDYIAIDASLHKKVSNDPQACRKEVFEKLKRQDVQDTERKHNLVLTEEDIYLEVSRFDYGDKNENPSNPLDKVWFYDKRGPKCGERVTAGNISKMFPKEYEESLLLCVCRKKEFTEVVKAAFDKWIKEISNEEPEPVLVDAITSTGADGDSRRR